jgi:hypothetical protein
MRSRDVSEKLKNLKMKVANEVGMLDYVSENNDRYQGDVPAKINGAHGGPIGGNMVRQMIEAEENRMSGS